MRTNTNNSKFQRGTGCFNCGVCGRKTRHTGEQAMGSDLCPECWEVGGLENEISDNGDEDGSIQASIDAYNQQAVNKGGKIAGYSPTKAAKPTKAAPKRSRASAIAQRANSNPGRKATRAKLSAALSLNWLAPAPAKTDKATKQMAKRLGASLRKQAAQAAAWRAEAKAESAKMAKSQKDALVEAATDYLDALGFGDISLKLHEAMCNSRKYNEISPTRAQAMVRVLRNTKCATKALYEFNASR